MDVAIIIGHCIIGTHKWRIGLGCFAKKFYRSCRDEKEKKTVLILLDKYSALFRKRKRNFGVY